MKALFVGGIRHGQVRDVSLDESGKLPGAVEGWHFWRFNGGGHDWPCYMTSGADQFDLEDAARIAGWPTWESKGEGALRPMGKV